MSDTKVTKGFIISCVNWTGRQIPYIRYNLCFWYHLIWNTDLRSVLKAMKERCIYFLSLKMGLRQPG